MELEFLRNLPMDEPRKLASLVEIKPGRVVSRALSRREECRITLLAFAQGEGVSAERYPGDTLYYVLEGDTLIEIGAQRQVLHCGECIAVPAGVSHTVGGGSPFKLLQITMQ